MNDAKSIENSWIWVTWESQRRNHSLSQRFGIPLHKLEYAGSLIARYLVLSYRTFALYFREKPKGLIVQNPSLVLSLISVLSARLIGCPLVIDAHNAGLFPGDGNSKGLSIIARFIIRKTDLTLVTNAALEQYVEEEGGSAIVLPDPLPSFDAGAAKHLESDVFCILFVCTWAADEPYREVLEATRFLGNDIKILFTGKHEGKVPVEFSRGSENIELLGFIPEQEFQRQLMSCDAVIDLTTREDCLLCGAYEAIAAEKPLLTSNTKALKEYFPKGTVFTNNDIESIVNGVKTLYENRVHLSSEVIIARQEIEERWKGYSRKFQEALGQLQEMGS